MTASATNPGIADCLDLAGTLANLGGDPDLLKELLDFFLEIAPQQLDELDAAIAAGDVAGAGLQAHSMKGGAANVGAVRMAAIARELEMMAKGGALGGATALAESLRAAFADLQACVPRVDWASLG